MRLSQWHKANVKPIHIGVYECDVDLDQTTFKKWNGRYWELNSFTIEDAYERHGAKSYFQKPKWRGIVK